MKVKDGFFLLRKRGGYTTFALIKELKKRFSFIKKVGHCGTLDPFAEGLVIVAVNRATRLTSFFLNSFKEYSGRIKLGVTTNTDDITGDILAVNDTSDISLSLVEEAIKKYSGEVMQRPPYFSAVKVQGERSYRAVRRGKFFDLPKRRVWVKWKNWNFIDGHYIDFNIKCSKGTYVRSLARDIGEELGVGGSLWRLERTCSGDIFLKDAKYIEDISEEDFILWWQIFNKVELIKLPQQIAFGLTKGDKRFIKGAGDFIERSLVNDTMVLYCSESDNMPRGILTKRSNSWEIGVNF